MPKPSLQTVKKVADELVSLRQPPDDTYSTPKGPLILSPAQKSTSKAAINEWLASLSCIPPNLPVKLFAELQHWLQTRLNVIKEGVEQWTALYFDALMLGIVGRRRWAIGRAYQTEIDPSRNLASGQPDPPCGSNGIVTIRFFTHSCHTAEDADPAGSERRGLL